MNWMRYILIIQILVISGQYKWIRFVSYAWNNWINWFRREPYFRDRHMVIFLYIHIYPMTNVKYSYVSRWIVQENNSFFQSSIRYLFTVSKEFILITLRRLIDVKGDGTETCGLDINNYAWVTVNNNFGPLVRRFANDFHSWRIILFLTRYFMSWTHNSAKNIHSSLISQLSPRTAVSDLALWCHHSWSVTSREREILALWRHICRLFLHAQIGAKAIFTSE